MTALRRTLLNSLFAAMAFGCMSAPVYALSIVGPNPHDDIPTGNPDPTYWGDDGNAADISDALEGFGIDPTALYKNNADGGVEEGLQNSYNTTYNADRSGAIISVQTGNGATAPLSAGTYYLVVKDGNQNPDWYAYAINWNGTETIELSSFWANTVGQDNGSISYVAIHNGPNRNVPDGGATAALLGVGLLGLAGLRRKS